MRVTRWVGLARNDAAATALQAAGAEAHRGDMQDLESLKQGAANSDGVIHAGFVHDFSRFKEVCEIDRLAIDALGSALEGSNKPLIVTSGTALVSPGQVATEDVVPPPNPNFPRVSEQTGIAWASRGVRAMAIRLSPSVHGDNDHGFVPILINLAREKGVAAYVGEGANRWTGVHRLDTAVLYRLALEKGTAGAHYHGVADEGVPFRDIAGIIGKRLNLPVAGKTPEQAAEHFGWFAHFAAIDCPASSKQTQEQLGWQPKHIGLLADMEQSASYFKG